MIINELSQLGLLRRGSAYGIEPAALFQLIERRYPGNDDELRGLLAALSGRCQTERISAQDLRAVLGAQEGLNHDVETWSGGPTGSLKTRERARVPPRAKRY